MGKMSNRERRRPERASARPISGAKPGINRLHGAAYEYLRRTDLTTNTYANNASGKPTADRVVDQYGFGSMSLYIQKI